MLHKKQNLTENFVKLKFFPKLEVPKYLLFQLPAAAQQLAVRPVDPNSDPSVKQALIISNQAYKHTPPKLSVKND